MTVKERKFVDAMLFKNWMFQKIILQKITPINSTILRLNKNECLVEKSQMDKVQSNFRINRKQV